MATHSNILAWKIPWTEKPGGRWSLGWQRVGHDWSDLSHFHIYINVIIIVYFFHELAFLLQFLLNKCSCVCVCVCVCVQGYTPIHSHSVLSECGKFLFCLHGPKLCLLTLHSLFLCCLVFSSFYLRCDHMCMHSCTSASMRYSKNSRQAYGN